MSKEEFRSLVLRMVVHTTPMSRSHFAMTDDGYRKVLDEMAAHDAVLAEMLRRHHAPSRTSCFTWPASRLCCRRTRCPR
jgi:hypothetical protein